MELRSTSNVWIDANDGQLRHEWTFFFETADRPTAPQLDADHATARLRAFLEPHRDDPWFYGAVGRALEILDGKREPRVDEYSVKPWGADDSRERLYAAASTVAGGKLSGMGGFDDFVEVDHDQLIPTFVQAFAASTRPGH